VSLGQRYVLTPIISTTILRTQSDDRLVALAKDGHERAFEALVERYRRPLLRHVRRILPEARAEDAVQQAFLNAWSALERGVEVREPRAWLYRVAQNAALNALRVQGYEYDELRESVRSSAAGPAEDHERRWVMRRTLAGLAALPEAQRKALLRTAVEGRSQEQVAAELGLSEGAVRGLVYRARTALRAAAAALTPAPLVGWAAAFASSDVPMNAAERITQVAAGGGTASVGAVLAKAGAVVAVTGALATGAVAVRDSTEGAGDSGSDAQADTVKPGAHRHGVTGAVPGASSAAGPEHGLAGERVHHGRGRGADHGRGEGRGRGRGEAEGKGRGGRGTGSSGGSGSNRGPSSGSGSSPGGSGSSGSSGSSNSGRGSSSSGSGSSGSGGSGGGDDHSGSGSGTSGGSDSSGPGPGPSGSGSSGSGGGPGPSGSGLSSSGPGDGGGAQIDGGGGGSSSSGPGPGTPIMPTTTTSGTSSSGSGSGGSGGGGETTTTSGSGSSGKGG
jgi:RNA polymerase sigma factor (sigma-70 family)